MNYQMTMKQKFVKWKYSKIDCIDLTYEHQFLLVASYCWWDPFAFLFVQGVIDDGSVFQISFSFCVSPRKSVFAPVQIHWQSCLSIERLCVVKLVHPVLEVLPGVCTSRFLPGFGRFDNLLGINHTI